MLLANTPVVLPGPVAVLLPPPEMRHFEAAAAQAGLWPLERMVLRHRAGSKPLRHITAFSRQNGSLQQQELLVKDEEEQYTAAFRTLLQEFYLAF